MLLEDEPLGFVTNLNSQVFVIELEDPTNRNRSGGCQAARGINSEEDDGLFYALSEESVQVFSFDSETGQLGDTPIFRTPVNAGLPFFGMDQIAFNAEEEKLYVGDSDSGSILVLNFSDLKC